MTRSQETSAHTAGPWEYGPAENYNGFWIAPRGRLPTLASVERCGQQLNVMAHNFPGSTEANARLIAAAPDLLDALNALVDWQAEVKHAVPRTFLDAARAAIAKAEGRS